MIPTEEETLSRREQGLRERHRRICDATRKIVATEGIAALSMRRIAAEAELSVNTLYNLVGGREEILSAVILDSLDEIRRSAPGISEVRDPIRRCRSLIEVATRSMIDDEDLNRPLILLSLSPGSAGGSRGHEIASRGTAMIRDAIEEAIAQKRLEDVLDPRVLSDHIYHAWEAAAQKWAARRIDGPEFLTRALYALDASLLGIATRETRRALVSRIKKHDRALLRALDRANREAQTT